MPISRGSSESTRRSCGHGLLRRRRSHVLEERRRDAVLFHKCIRQFAHAILICETLWRSVTPSPQSAPTGEYVSRRAPPVSTTLVVTVGWGVYILIFLPVHDASLFVRPSNPTYETL